MNILKTVATGIMALTVSVCANAQDNCDIHLSVVPIEQGEDVPDGANDFLSTRLANAVTACGVTANTDAGQFFVTGKFNHVTEDAVAGPPAQVAIHTLLTLYIGDLANQQVFASKTFELRGVGTSEQRAFINSFGSLNARNANLQQFIEQGKQKVISYFDKHYPQVFSQARRAASQHHYDQALSLVTSVPECCAGYNEAYALTLQYFKQYIDFEGQHALRAARSLWAKEPNAAGASKALAKLMEIDPESSAYVGAESLMAEIKASVADDREFELREKYHDRVNLEKQRIAAARAVGVAWGNGQKAKTTNIAWIR